MDRLRNRIADRRVLALVKAFLKAGILGQDGTPTEMVGRCRTFLLQGTAPPNAWLLLGSLLVAGG